MTPLDEYIAANEIDWWIRKATQASVRKLIKQNTGVVIPRTKEESKAFFFDNFQVYTKWRRKPILKEAALNNFQWDRLESVVRNLQPIIQGIGIESALHIVRSRVSTNKILLRGLPKRLHYWE